MGDKELLPALRHLMQCCACLCGESYMEVAKDMLYRLDGYDESQCGVLTQEQAEMAIAMVHRWIGAWMKGPRMKEAQHVMTEKEWLEIPVTFGTDIAAKVFGCSHRYAQSHAEELGAVKVAGHWVFSKPKTAAMLGI